MTEDSQRATATEQLLESNAGDRTATDDLIVSVLGELRDVAAMYMGRERRDHTLQPTALVNEAYLRLVDGSKVDWSDEVHFRAIAARAMRRVLVEHARARQAIKRGGDERRISVDWAEMENASEVDLIALDEALRRLSAHHERQAQMVELRFFGGLTPDECAKALNISRRQVERDWTTARARLKRDLAQHEGTGELNG